ncbi:F0F1 ATP synthase subunit B [bacterium]|nr:F0F1 ATP synthase subunit B [bacterium]
MLDIHPGLMIWTIITFVILLFILKKAAWTPILKALDDREMGIKANIEAARKAKEEADLAIEENRRKLAEAQAEAQKVIAKARQDAERLGEQLKAQYKAEADAARERAIKEIDLERQAAVNEIRKEITYLAVAAAEKIVGKSISAEDHKRLVMEGIQENFN